MSKPSSNLESKLKLLIRSQSNRTLSLQIVRQLILPGGVRHESPTHKETSVPWSKDKIATPKVQLKLKEIWAIRVRLEMSESIGTSSIQSGG